MLVLAILLSLLFSALFSGSEMAFVSTNKLQVELKRKKGSRQGTILAGFFDHPSVFLSTMLVGNNIALVIFTTLLGDPIESFISNTFGLSNEIGLLFLNTILITLVILFLGEFYPKTIFRLFANDILYFLAVPLRILQFLLYLPAQLMNIFTKLVLRFIPGDESDAVRAVITRVDLEQFVRSTSQQGDEEIDTELFQKALHLKKVRVKDCMVPRQEIESIEVSSEVEALVQQFEDTKMSRIIVYNEEINNVQGYVHHQQMLKRPKTIRHAILDILFVPEQMSVSDLMNNLIKENQSIACVVDEYGAVSGIITLEDILEEIFGEIEDEHDDEDILEEQLSENEYRFSGRVEIAHINEKYPDLQLPTSENHNTLSGYLVMTTGDIPKEGEELKLDGYKFVLELVSDTKIEVVRVIKLTKADEEMD